jgi:hypothetical protein
MEKIKQMFDEILQKVVLNQNPDLYLYARKLEANMIPDKKHVVINTYKGEPLHPKVKDSEKIVIIGKNYRGYLKVSCKVVVHDKVGNRVLLEDGSWYELNKMEENRADDYNIVNDEIQSDFNRVESNPDDDPFLS